MSVSFIKMVGTGNDFIVLDARRRRLPENLPGLARQLCRRARAVGADGLLVVEPSRKADVRMRIINPDGSEAAMCGNGVRCVALHAADGRPRADLTIETKAGLIRAQVLSPRRVRVTLTDPSPVRPVHLTVLMRPVTAYVVDTGVPHAVIVVADIGAVDLERLGPAIRHHRTFRPSGANVDFIQILDRHTMRLRTYERGVEAETLACGTGAAAAALAAATFRRCQPPVTVYPTSGERLVIRFEPRTTKQSGQWKHVSLEGEVHKVFEGVVP